MNSIDAQSRMRAAKKVVEHMFIATFDDDREDSIFRNPWIVAKVI